MTTHLALRDRKSGAYMSSALDSKTSPYTVAYCVGAIKEMGYKRFVYMSDNEPAILKLKDDVTRNLIGV